MRLARERAAGGALPDRPDVYYDLAPSGSYPIVALRTVPCEHFLRGGCTPCAYSARAYPRGVEIERLHGSLEIQLESFLADFYSHFSNWSRDLRGYRLRPAPDRPWYMLQIAGSSSFFRGAEIPPPQRRRILERLVAFQEEQALNLHVMLETRPEHLVAAHESGELATLRPLLRALDVAVNLGFEARDPFHRNVLFVKDLREADFLRAVEVAHEHRLDPGAFVFAGGIRLSVSEILREARQSLQWLAKLDVFANLMVPNLQSYTLPHLLSWLGAYALPQPWFLLDLADLAVEHRPRRRHGIAPFHWFIGGLTSDPPPENTIFDASELSDDLSAEIRDCFKQLVKDHDVVAYRARCTRLRRDSSYQRYAACRALPAGPLTARLAEALDLAEANLQRYDATMRRAAAGHPPHEALGCCP